jgi:hypothetical protein
MKTFGEEVSYIKAQISNRCIKIILPLRDKKLTYYEVIFLQSYEVLCTLPTENLQSK